MSQTDSSRAIARWRSGVEFSSAWVTFGDPYAVEKLRRATTRAEADCQRILMVADLWAALQVGRLQAFGKCVAPEVSNGPILIPAHTFEFEPPRGIEDTNDFEISGWRYEGVKVVRVGADAVDADAATDIETEPMSTTDSSANGDAGEPITPVARKRGGGRPDTYQYSESVLRALYAIDGNSKLSAEKLHPAFAVEFQRQFPRDQYQSDPPNVRTLRDQIKRYRQELAKTGNK